MGSEQEEGHVVTCGHDLRVVDTTHLVFTGANINLSAPCPCRTLFALRDSSWELPFTTAEQRKSNEAVVKCGKFTSHRVNFRIVVIRWRLEAPSRPNPADGVPQGDELRDRGREGAPEANVC